MNVQTLLKNIVLRLNLYFLIFIILILSISQNKVYGRENKKSFQKNISNQFIISKNLWNTIYHLQKYGNRTSYENQWKVANWLFKQLKKFKIETKFYSYEYDSKIWPNVIGKIGGGKKYKQVIMLVAHFDSVSSNSQNKAPGADDNGSGVAVILEVARILSNYQFSRTVIFCFFSNEEKGKLGSKAFVKKIVNDKTNVQAVISLDGLGYNRPNFPIYFNAIKKYNSYSGKLIAYYDMCLSYFSGFIYGKNIVKIAGRFTNQNLVKLFSKIMSEESAVRVKEIIKDDCG